MIFKARRVIKLHVMRGLKALHYETACNAWLESVAL